MPLTRAAQQQREADTVRSAPGRPGFYCPDLDALDGHLRRLASGRHADSLTLAGRRRVDEDIDALLLRRWAISVFERGMDCS